MWHFLHLASYLGEKINRKWGQECTVFSPLLSPKLYLIIIFSAFLSGRSEQPHLANQRHVPALCRGQRRGTTPGWQEAQIQHQDQE